MKVEDSAVKSDLKGLLMTDLDRQNIQNAVNLFKTCNFEIALDNGKTMTWTGRQWINFVKKDARKDIIKENRPQSEINFSRRMAMPPPLWTLIKESYPAIMSDMRQFEQLMRWFPEFDIAKH